MSKQTPHLKQPTHNQRWTGNRRTTLEQSAEKKYSRISIAWTPTAHLLMLIRTGLLNHYEILPIASENKYFRKFSYFIMKYTLIVLIWIASSRRYWWVHSTYNYCVDDRKVIPKLSSFASWPGAINNPQYLELPISRSNFHGPKEIRVIEVRLYLNGMGGGFALKGFYFKKEINCFRGANTFILV